MNLSEQMIECVKATNPQELTPTGRGLGLNDYDQRSAIGMARTWVENREPIRWKPEQVHYEKRDALAAAIVDLMVDAEPEECVAALRDARRVVNAPFQIEAHNGARLGKPGEKKKAKESEK